MATRAIIVEIVFDDETGEVQSVHRSKKDPHIEPEPGAAKLGADAGMFGDVPHWDLYTDGTTWALRLVQDN